VTNCLVIAPSFCTSCSSSTSRIVCSTSAREATILADMRASMSWTIWNSKIGLPNCSRWRA